MGLEPNSEENIFHLAGLEVLVRDCQSQAQVPHLRLLHEVVSNWTSEPEDRWQVRKLTEIISFHPSLTDNNCNFNWLVKLSSIPDSGLLVVESLETTVSDHDDGLELLTLLLSVEHPDEEAPDAPAGIPLKVAVEQFVAVSEFQGLEPGAGGIVTAGAEE